MKICCKCGKVKNINNFYKDKSRIDGIDVRCKICAREKSKKYENKNYEKTKDSKRKYYHKTKKIRKEKKRIYRNKKAIYSSFQHHKYFYKKDNIKCGDNNELLSPCKNCNKYFNPTNNQVQHRIEILQKRPINSPDWKGKKSDLYCSEECKKKSKIYKIINLNPYHDSYYSKVWNNIEWKRNLRENRDMGRCWYPLCICNNKIGLVLHHIDYNKKNCISHNLITICRRGNRLSEYDKEWHKNYFKALMYNRGL